MTNYQTRAALNQEFKDVKYILTSNMRTKLLLALYEIPKNLDELRNELKHTFWLFDRVESARLMAKKPFREICSNSFSINIVCAFPVC